MEDKDLADLFKVEIMKAEEVAKILKTSPPRVKGAILNGTMPIGAVFEKSHPGEVDRVAIVKKRFEAWINAKDLIV